MHSTAPWNYFCPNLAQVSAFFSLFSKVFLKQVFTLFLPSSHSKFYMWVIFPHCVFLRENIWSRNTTNTLLIQVLCCIVHRVRIVTKTVQIHRTFDSGKGQNLFSELRSIFSLNQRVRLHVQLPPNERHSKTCPQADSLEKQRNTQRNRLAELSSDLFCMINTQVFTPTTYLTLPKWAFLKN